MPARGASSLTTAFGNFAASVSGYSTYQLTDFGLAAGAYGLSLSGVRSVTLNAASGSGAHSFTLANWSGNAALNGAGSNNTFTNVPGPNTGGVSDVLSDSSLQVTGALQQTTGLSDIQTANLVGGKGTNSFDISSWTGGGSLTGPQSTANTLSATNDITLFTFADTLFQRTSHGDITLSGIQTANLTGGASANTFTATGWSGNANLDGKGGSDIYNLTVTGSGTGTVNVTDTGATGTDTLNVTANVPASKSTLVNSTGVRVGTQRVNYGTSGIEVLNVIGGTGGLTFNVQSTSASVSTTKVQTTGISNVINVGSTAGVTPASAGVVNTIVGAQSRRWRARYRQYRRHGRQLGADRRSYGHATDRAGPGSQGITYSGLALLNISLGAGLNTFNVQSTTNGTSTTVNAGAGNDTVNVLTTSSPLTVNTQAGTDTVNVSSNAPTNTGDIVGDCRSADDQRRQRHSHGQPQRHRQRRGDHQHADRLGVDIDRLWRERQPELCVAGGA